MREKNPAEQVGALRKKANWHIARGNSEKGEHYAGRANKQEHLLNAQNHKSEHQVGHQGEHFGPQMPDYRDVGYANVKDHGTGRNRLKKEAEEHAYRRATSRGGSSGTWKNPKNDPSAR